MLIMTKILPAQPVPFVPFRTLGDPIPEPFVVSARFDKVLHLRLLELSVAEDELSGRDLVTEGLAALCDPKGQLLPGGRLDVLEVDEDALSRLRAQVGDGRLILHRPDVSPEHGVEHARFA